MTDARRQQLNDYFVAELDQLRHGAAEFSADYPNIADELQFSRGHSRDPHVEHLLQAFAWMMSRLRMNLETEAETVPAMLLQQLYPHLVSAMPSMAIIELAVSAISNFENGYELPAGTYLEPIKLKANPEVANKLRRCRFTTCHKVGLWPLSLSYAATRPINEFAVIDEQVPKSQSLLHLQVRESDEGAVKSLKLNRPLRFYINLDHSDSTRLYDFLARHVVSVAQLDAEGQLVRILPANHFQTCGFDDDERVFPYEPTQELGFSLLQDYFAFPEKFMFFELTGDDNVRFEQGEMNLMLVLDEKPPNNLKIDRNTFKLNCVPVINLFEKTSEPIPLHHKHYRYRLFASRDHHDCFEIYQVKKLFSVSKQGELRELAPYFSIDNRDELQNDYRWVSQLEPSHRKKLPGNETYVSLFNDKYVRDCPTGETIYAETLSCNRTMCEWFDAGQELAVIGSAPAREIRLLTKPTRYRPRNLRGPQLWELLSHLSLYFVSLSEPDIATDTLQTILRLHAHPQDPVSQRQIDSVKRVDTSEAVSPVRNAGWRGYHHGTKFQITLSEHRFEGSTILFGSVLQHFLAMYGHLNAFVQLDINLGNGGSYSWPPMMGQKSLV